MQAEELFQRRVNDLVKAAYLKNYVVFTDFFDLNELNILHSMPASSFQGVRLILNGGCTTSERQMAAFVPDAFSYAENDMQSLRFPIALLHIKPSAGRFTEKLTHRDYLGAVMSLGIERSVLGDLIIGEAEAFLFAEEEMADYICSGLTSVKHTPVKTVKAEEVPEELLHPETEEITGSVSSVRLDSIIALGFRLSRSKAQQEISAGMVFVNSRQILSDSLGLKPGDIISVRGKGKMIFDSPLSSTKKGRQMVKLLKYK